jgi:hypothetical protein
MRAYSILLCFWLSACAVAPPAPEPLAVAAAPRPIIQTVTKLITPTIPLATCDATKPKVCTAMASCAEAVHYLKACNYAELDGRAHGPKNGIPCENLCGGTVAAKCERLKNAPHFMNAGRMSKGAGVADCV